MALSTEQEFPFWSAWGTVLQGWAIAEQGQEEEGIAQMRQGLAAYRAHGGRDWTVVFACPAGRGAGKQGRQRKGLACWLRR